MPSLNRYHKGQRIPKLQWKTLGLMRTWAKQNRGSKNYFFRGDTEEALKHAEAILLLSNEAQLPLEEAIGLYMPNVYGENQ